MRRGWAALAVWFFAAVGAWAQTNYRYGQMAPDPALKSAQTPESVLMRAGYEARQGDCEDARKHLSAVEQERPRWAAVYAARLICARSEANDTEQRAALDALKAVQAGNWVWWRDSAELHAKDGEIAAAVSDMGQAIDLRPWEMELYARRSAWREQLREFSGAYADAVRTHELELELGAPLERMAQLAVRAGHSAAEAQQDHVLAELNPEQLPLKVRNDAQLPVAGMSLQEALLRASYAQRVGNGTLALRMARMILQRWPKTGSALAMFYPLWKGGEVDEEEARAAIEELVRLPAEAEGTPRNPGGRAGARSAGPTATQRPEYYRWLLEMGVADEEKARLYRLMIAMEPYEAKNYAELAALELSETPQQGDREPSTATNIPWWPTAPQENGASGRGTPLPRTMTGQGVNPENRPPTGAAGATAEANYQMAITLDPSEPAYYFGLAQVLDRRAAFPLEIMALNMALIGDPGNAEYQAARSRLP